MPVPYTLKLFIDFQGRWNELPYFKYAPKYPRNWALGQIRLKSLVVRPFLSAVSNSSACDVLPSNTCDARLYVSIAAASLLLSTAI